MNYEHAATSGREHVGSDEQFAKLRAALGSDGQNTPEIVAIFQQIKNLRESDRSLRSIRRNLELDNMPVIDHAEEVASGQPAPSNELSTILDSFITLKREKDILADRLAKMIATADQLEAKVQHLTDLVEKRTEDLNR